MADSRVVAAAKASGGEARRAGVSGRGRARTVDGEAREAERQARRRGAQGRQDNSGEGAAARLIARDRAIVAGHHAGISSAELAKKWDVTKRTVDRVLKAARERRSALTVPSMELVQRTLQEYESQQEMFMAIGVEMLGRQADAPAVGAFKAAADAFERWKVTLMELGVLPEELRVFRSEAELGRLGQLVLDTFEDVRAGRLELQAGYDRVWELVGRQELPVLEGKATG